MAIAGFVTALVGIPILGLVFGYIALSQIKQTKQDGHGFALAGIIISYVYLGFALLAMIMVVLGVGVFASLFAKPLVQELPNIINAAESASNSTTRVNNSVNSPVNNSAATNRTRAVNTTIEANEPFELEIF